MLWARSADTQSAMASITKMTTAIVALENADLDTVCTVSENAASVGESTAGLKAGMKVSLRDLLVCLLVHSGNDAAVAIAENVGGDVDSFVAMMNDKVTDMGLKNTHYANPHGLDADGHYSSAADISVIARYAMKNDTFREIVNMRTATLTLGGEEVTFKNTNSLLTCWDDLIGCKTGYTNNAGECLASCASRNGVELYAVVLGCDQDIDRFTDSYKLLNWGFAHYKAAKLATSSDTLADVPMSGYVNRTVPAGVSDEVSTRVLDYDGDISVDVHFNDLPDGVHEGDTIGSVTWRQGEQVIVNTALVAKKTVRAPTGLESVWTHFRRLIGLASGDPCVAKSALYAQTVTVERDKKDGSGSNVPSNLVDELNEDIIEVNQATL